ncbi:MAG: hypothetical protein AB7O52_19110 [Planctomycetota bacterium]
MWFLGRSGLFAVLVALGSLVGPGLLFAQEEGDGEGKPSSSAPADLLLALRSVDQQSVEEDGLRVEVSVIPDEYVYGMVAAFQECQARGFNELEEEKELTKVHERTKKNRNKPVFSVSIEVLGGKKHFWLQKKLASHVEIQIGKKKKLTVDEKSSPSYDSWKIYELNRKRDLTMRLAYFRKLAFEVKIAGTGDDISKETIELTLVELLRYTEVEKRSEYERIGINTGVRQLALASASDMNFPAIKMSFYPAKWKLPPLPPRLSALLARLP